MSRSPVSPSRRDDRRRARAACSRRGAGGRRKTAVPGASSDGRRDAGVAAAGRGVDRGARRAGSPPPRRDRLRPREDGAHLAAGERVERRRRERPAGGRVARAGLRRRDDAARRARPVAAHVPVEPAVHRAPAAASRSAGLFDARWWPKSPSSSESGTFGWSRRMRLAKRVTSSTGKRSSVKPLATKSGAGGVDASTWNGEWKRVSVSTTARAYGSVYGGRRRSRAPTQPATSASGSLPGGREEAHRPAGHERLAHRLPRPDRVLRRREDRGGDRGLDDADRRRRGVGRRDRVGQRASRWGRSRRSGRSTG